MGEECPNGHGRQFVAANITADGTPAVKNDDIVAKRLACGCVVSGPDYEAFQKSVLDIRNKEKLAIAAAKENARKSIGAAFKAYNDKKGDKP